MLNMITNIPKVLKKFLNRFKERFSNIQFKAFCNYIAGLFLSHRRVSLESIAGACKDINYENLQYFISESHFDINDINDARLSLLNHLRPTKTTKQGLLVIPVCRQAGMIPLARNTANIPKALKYNIHQAMKNLPTAIPLFYRHTAMLSKDTL